MADDTKSSNTEADNSPQPEMLKSQTESAEPDTQSEPESGGKIRKGIKRVRNITHRPSHKATFIGLAVIAAIVALNAGAAWFLMSRQQAENDAVNREDVILSPETLKSLGVDRNTVGDVGAELVVGPDARFNGQMVVGGDVSIAGQLQLNSRFSAADASLTRLQAGQTDLQGLNVSGEISATSLALRQNLSVAGTTQLQGPVTMSQLLTVNNNLNVSGNLAVGGILSARAFQASSLISDSTLTIGGHIITRGGAPGVSAGAAAGSNGTASISGSDTAGTVAVNMGTGAGNGTVANISFRQGYSTTPRVVITPVGRSVDYYVNRNANGFSIGVSGSVSPGGYAFDYIVMQ